MAAPGPCAGVRSAAQSLRRSTIRHPRRAIASRLIIDGYNLMHKMPDLAQLVGQDLERSRARLIARLAEFRHQRKVAVTVVFDGAAVPVQDPVLPGAGIRVIYSSPPQNADARIRALVEAEKQPRLTTLVSSDHAAVNHARACGMNVMSSEEFAARLTARRDAPADAGDKPEMRPDDVKEWEEYFGRKSTKD